MLPTILSSSLPRAQAPVVANNLGLLVLYFDATEALTALSLSA